jgi:hypothetical protein
VLLTCIFHTLCWPPLLLTAPDTVVTFLSYFTAGSQESLT